MIHSYPAAKTPATPIPAPSTRTPQKRKYDDLVHLIVQAGGDPIAVTDLNTINGKTSAKKSIAVHGAMRARGWRVRTSHQHGYLYCWLVGPQEATVVVPEFGWPAIAGAEPAL